MIAAFCNSLQMHQRQVLAVDASRCGRIVLLQRVNVLVVNLEYGRVLVSMSLRVC